MTVSAAPEAVLSHLPRADGSATYSYAGYTITASANGPIEAQRRDEDPYRALVDVIVRPAAGVGGTRERHLESILESSLRQLILVNSFPRGLIQVVLQIRTTPENEYVNTKLVQAHLNLPVIPALLQTAVLALLSAAVPLKATATSAIVAVLARDDAKEIIVDPTPRQIEKALSTHVLAFTSHDDLLLVESEGDFSMQEWEKAHAAAQTVCCRPTKKARVVDMVLDDEQHATNDMRQFLRTTMEGKIAADLHWK